MPARNAVTQPSDERKAETQESGGICFVIMPFGGWFDPYYESIYVQAIRATGLMPRRADDLYRPSSIVSDIWDLTTRSKIVFADLTSRNANVLYELGLAHAIAKPVVMVTQDIEDIPFDLRGLRIIEYKTEAPNWSDQLRARIQSSISEVLEDPARSIPPTFLEVRAEGAAAPVSAHEKTLLEIKQELDSLRLEFRAASRPEPLPNWMLPGQAGAKIRYGLSANVPDAELLAFISEDFGLTPAAALAVIEDIKRELGMGDTENASR